ncbi:CHAT domain-containing protein [Capilliphycus salinus ALCB114379]|uniref:CHAT domain-containing protein n=1 Tax=Capilliphycus salinus TaxID=2768948 RepID=UPI0039A43101
MATQKSVLSFYQRILSFVFGVILSFFLAVGLSFRQPVNSLESIKVSRFLKNTSSTPEINSLSSQSSIFQLEQQARDFYQAGNFEKAVEIWREIKTRETDQLRQAASLGNLSLSLQKLGDWEAANQAIQDSLELLDSLSNHPDQTILTIQGQVLSIQGNLYFSQGKYSQALESWQVVETIYRQTQNQNGIIETLLNQAQALQGLGLYRRAEKILMEVNQSLQTQPDSTLKVSQLLHLTHVLRVLGKLGNLDYIESNVCGVSEDYPLKNSALSELSAGLVLLELLETAKALESPPEIHKVQLNLANLARAIYQQQKQLENTELAKKVAQTAVVCYEQAATSSTTITQIRSKLNALSFLLELTEWLPLENDTDWQRKIQSKINFEKTNWRKIESQINGLPSGRTAIYAKIDLVQSLMKLAGNQPELDRKIEPILLSAIEEAKRLGDPRVQSYTRGYLGQLYEQRQQWKEAKIYTEDALFLAQSIPAEEIVYQWQWQLGRIFKNQGKSKRQSAIASYQGAVQSLQSLRKDLVAIRQDVQFDFRDRVEPVYRELVDLLLTSENPPPENLKQAREVLEKLQLAELDNFFQDACLEAQPKAIDQIDSNAIVIYGILLENRLEIIASLPKTQDLFHYRTPVSKTELTSTLKQLRFNLQKPYAYQEIKRLSEQLYRGLLEPLETKLKGDETLVFVLDGELRNLPMSALYDGQHYLIEKHPVVIQPGLQLLDPKPISRPLNALSAGLVEPPEEFRQQFALLLNVPEELEKIQDVVAESEQLLNEEFNRENLEKQMSSSSFEVIHLATHGQFSSQAEKTFILASDGAINIKQLDNLFRIQEPNKTRNIDLLVLSACETAPGDNRAVLGLAGMAVRAGARSTIASLWSLNDRSAVEFMGHFYEQLVQGKSRAEALRQAQLMFLQQKNGYDAPLYWAPYILVGDWR